MKIRRILGENGPMTEVCNGGAYPAAILTEGGDAFVQGYRLGTEERAELKAPEGEDFVRIPLEVLKKIAVQVVEA